MPPQNTSRGSALQSALAQQQQQEGQPVAVPGVDQESIALLGTAGRRVPGPDLLPNRSPMVGGGRYRISGNYTSVPLQPINMRAEFEAAVAGGTSAAGLGAEVHVLGAAHDATPSRRPTYVGPTGLPKLAFDVGSFRALSDSDREIVLERTAGRSTDAILQAIDALPDRAKTAAGRKIVNTGFEAATGIKGIIRAGPAGVFFNRIVFGEPVAQGEEEAIAAIQERERAVRAAEVARIVALRIANGTGGVAFNLVVRDP